MALTSETKNSPLPLSNISNRRYKRSLTAATSSLLFDSCCFMEILRATTITIILFTQLTPAQCFLFQSKRVPTASSHLISPVLDTCCSADKADDFCRAFARLSATDQHALRVMMDCESNFVMEKRKPNFIRYGRAAPPAFSNSRRLADPNFLRFGRNDPAIAHGLNSIFEKKSANSVSANFLRFGKAASDPNFLRFGKRAPSPSTSAILGAAADSSAPNFLRFGRSAPVIGSGDLMQERFSREYRKPNFLRFG